MPLERWTEAEIALLQRLVNNGLDSRQISEEFARSNFKRSQKAIYRKIQKERKGTPGEWIAKTPPSTTRWFGNPIRVEVDKILLVFDLHIPFHDAKWLDRVTALAIKRGCRAIGIGGDLIDFSAFSFYGRQADIETGDEVHITQKTIRAIRNNFDTIIYAGGNHESRLARLTDGRIDVATTMEMLINTDGVQITDYQWFEVISGGEKFYVEHPQNASMIATSVARALCSKYLCHIVSGHGHLWGMTKDPSGRFWAIDAGMCADAKRLAYTSQRHSRRPQMLTGAVIIEDGVPLLLCPENISVYGG